MKLSPLPVLCATVQMALVPVTDCAGIQDVYPNLMASRLTFSPQLPDSGCNPCVVEPCGWIDPVYPTTWGGLKLLFGK